MKYRFKILMVIVFAAFLLEGAANAFPQNVGSTSKSKKNSISILVSFHNFFDGHRMFQRKPENAGGYKPVVKGLEYQRLVSDHLGFVASAKFCNHAYWDEEEFGDVAGRGATFFEINAIYLIWKLRGVSLFGLLGPGFRYGNEGVLAAKNARERLYDFYKLRDPAITAGLRIQYDLPTTFTLPLIKNFTIAAESKFTQIIWRYNSSLPYRTFYPNRSTRQMFTLQFGLGYRF